MERSVTSVFAHLLLNAARKGSCSVLSVVSRHRGLPCSGLWEGTGQYNSQGFTILQGKGLKDPWGTWDQPIYSYSFQALLKVKEFREWAAEQLFHRVWAEPFSFAGRYQRITKADPSIHRSLIKSAHKKWLAEISIKTCWLKKEFVLFFFNCSSFSLETTHLHDMRSVQPLNYHSVLLEVSYLAMRVCYLTVISDLLRGTWQFWLEFAIQRTNY